MEAKGRKFLLHGVSWVTTVNMTVCLLVVEGSRISGVIFLIGQHQVRTRQVEQSWGRGRCAGCLDFTGTKPISQLPALCSHHPFICLFSFFFLLFCFAVQNPALVWSAFWVGLNPVRPWQWRLFSSVLPASGVLACSNKKLRFYQNL